MDNDCGVERSNDDRMRTERCRRTDRKYRAGRKYRSQAAGSEEAAIPDEDMEMDPEFGVDSEETSAAVFGVITDVGENEIIVDNQSGVSSEGEIILMIDPDHTYLLDGINRTSGGCEGCTGRRQL